MARRRRVEITGSLDLLQVATTRERLLAMLTTRPPWTIDLCGIEDCDAAGVQLLWAMRRAADAAGGRLDVIGGEAVVGAACEAIHLTPATVLANLDG